jgi:hypothetical protein
MNPQIKELWCTALESGEYPQGKDRLEQSGKFCCLGVLCKLAAEAGVCERDAVHSYGSVSYGREVSYLPVSVMTWAGLAECIPNIDYKDGHTYGLAHLNDYEGLTFTEIATLIREQL